jgi:hypothetical protein
MTIEIQRPELEALILERMKSGFYQSVEDVLLHALKLPLLPVNESAGPRTEKVSVMGNELIQAMQASPYKDIYLERGGESMPVRDVAF